VRERVEQVHNVKLELELRRLGVEQPGDHREPEWGDGGCST